MSQNWAKISKLRQNDLVADDSNDVRKRDFFKKVIDLTFQFSYYHI